jgi:hypothetical protein
MVCHFSVGKEYDCSQDHQATDPTAMIVVDEEGEEWFAERTVGNNMDLLGFTVKFEII